MTTVILILAAIATCVAVFLVAAYALLFHSLKQLEKDGLNS